jgi:hypothetical protein
MRHYLIPKPILDKLNSLEESSAAQRNVPEFSKYDLNSALDFLKQYKSNKATFESYRREIERLIQWAWLIEEKSTLELKRQDIESYISFCLNPPKSWIGTKNR